MQFLKCINFKAKIHLTLTMHAFKFFTFYLRSVSNQVFVFKPDLQCLQYLHFLRWPLPWLSESLADQCTTVNRLSHVTISPLYRSDGVIGQGQSMTHSKVFRQLFRYSTSNGMPIKLLSPYLEASKQYDIFMILKSAVSGPENSLKASYSALTISVAKHLYRQSLLSSDRFVQSFLLIQHKNGVGQQ